MRALLPLLLLAGCSHRSPGPLVAAEAASVVVFGRGMGDIAVSAVTGRDCSIVRLDRGQTYCAPEDAPRPAQFCSRSLGTVDCWANPDAFAVRPRGVADSPAPTAAQQAYRAAPWPKALTAGP